MESLPFDDQLIRDILESPQGTYKAVLIDHGVYWQNWIYIIRPGMAELRYRADSWITDAQWVDDNTFRWSTSHDPIPSRHYWVVDVANAELKK